MRQRHDQPHHQLMEEYSRPPAALLTARELQIAVLIAQGFSEKAIGVRLGVRLLTVRTHRIRAYSKLGVSRRSTLAARIAGTVALHRQVLPRT